MKVMTGTKGGPNCKIFSVPNYISIWPIFLPTRRSEGPLACFISPCSTQLFRY